MLFTDWKFFLFVAVMVALVEVARSDYLKRLVLLIGSVFFYLQFPWPFVVLLGLTVVVDFALGLALSRRKSRILLFLSLAINFLPLLAFKFLAFSRDLNLSDQGLWEDLIVPLGISFYTFKSASYIFDVYRGISAPCRRLTEYALFVTYFPALLSGPVSRFNEFQSASRSPGLSLDGCQRGATLIIYGLVKKIVVADLIHDFSRPFWGMRDAGELNFSWSSLLILSTYVKLYCDFSGYTDIARGTSLLFNIRLPKNFDFPFFAQDPTDFWNRQHMSMSRWFSDYVYLPIVKIFRALPVFSVLVGLWVTFALSAIWHGVSFGAFLFFVLQATYASAYFLLRRFPHFPMNRIRQTVGWPLTQLVAMTSVFFLLAPGREEIMWVLRGLTNFSSGEYPWINTGLLVVTLSFLFIHFIHHRLRNLKDSPVMAMVRPAVLALFLFVTVILNLKTVNFIYYQF